MFRRCVSEKWQCSSMNSFQLSEKINAVRSKSRFSKVLLLMQNCSPNQLFSTFPCPELSKLMFSKPVCLQSNVLKSPMFSNCFQTVWYCSSSQSAYPVIMKSIVQFYCFQTRLFSHQNLLNFPTEMFEQTSQMSKPKAQKLNVCKPIVLKPIVLRSKSSNLVFYEQNRIR